MIKSMTGYGRQENVTEEYKILVEIKSVNHKYCDINVKLPRHLNMFDAYIRNILNGYISRGKVDVYINYEDYTKSGISVKYNNDIAARYIETLNQISSDFGISGDINAAILSRYPEVITVEESTADENVLKEIVRKAIVEAAEKFVESRETEGVNLKKDVLEKLDYIEECVAFIEKRYPKVLEEYREKLYSKVSELLGSVNVDESVLATELIVYADRICVDEEMVRLKSHIEAMRTVLESEGSIGRKLDFIAQELNREANTTLSKSSDIAISDKAIDLKTAIEKIREQVQNIE